MADHGLEGEMAQLAQVASPSNLGYGIGMMLMVKWMSMVDKPQHTTDRYQ